MLKRCHVWKPSWIGHMCENHVQNVSCMPTMLKKSSLTTMLKKFHVWQPCDLYMKIRSTAHYNKMSNLKIKFQDVNGSCVLNITSSILTYYTDWIDRKMCKQIFLYFNSFLWPCSSLNIYFGHPFVKEKGNDSFRPDILRQHTLHN